MHCYNCQNFGLVLANCKQRSWCLWCCGGHLHRGCPEKKNRESMPSCNWTLVEGKKPDPASYQGCSHMKGELQRSRAKQAPKGSSGQSSPMQLLCVKTCNINRRLCRHMGKACVILRSSICDNRKFREKACQYRCAVQLAVTELNKAVSEKDKIMDITKVVLNETEWLLEFTDYSES